jgi:HAD superfamily hydrolase (TIGR01458 family)
VRRIAPLLAPDVLEDFDGFEITHESPEAVVVGDMGDLWSAAILNQALRHLLAGARLVALARTRIWRRESGLVMDAGPYVAALEYAAGLTAEVVGKPAPAIFEAAVASMGVGAREAAMVGDDPESDVEAAMRAGLRGILVLSGKVGEKDVPRLAVRPDAIFPSLVEAVDAICAG